MTITGAHRSYTFTINNDTCNDLVSMMECPFKYMIFGFEKGETGTRHIQGYVQFWDPVTFLTAIKYFPRAHIEVAKGTFQQNIRYCSKDNDFYEIGIKPTIGGKVTFDQVEQAFSDPDNNMTIIRQYGKAYNQVKQLHIKSSQVDTKYFVYSPKKGEDILGKILDYFQQQITPIMISELSGLAAYETEEYDTVLLLLQWVDPLFQYYPRGVPITYKYGYEYRTCKPKNFIIVTNDYKEFFPFYKQLK